MPTPYDVLGVIFGVLSLLESLTLVYDFLKSRQPQAQVGLYRSTMHETRDRLAELIRRGHFAKDAAGSATKYSSALDKYYIPFK